eukprot:1275984-Karenia_brevis.AAC.1
MMMMMMMMMFVPATKPHVPMVNGLHIHLQRGPGPIGPVGPIGSIGKGDGDSDGDGEMVMAIQTCEWKRKKKAANMERKWNNRQHQRSI